MKKKAQIKYFSLTDEMPKKEKLEWFTENRLADIPFESIQPDKNNNWLNITDNDFDELIPLYDKKENSIFQLCFNGIQSNRDDWVYDFENSNLIKKIAYFVDKYNESVDKQDMNLSIKWTYSLEDFFKRKEKIGFDQNLIKTEDYRPFFRQFHYCSKPLNHRLTQNHYDVWGMNLDKKNYVLNFTGISSGSFATFAVKRLINVQYQFNAVNVSLYKYDKSGNCLDNITDWGLKQFTDHYKDDTITKEDIFHYVYTVLHNPGYREKYETNLKREFPRIPFYDNFRTWTAWGKSLMKLHIDYETAEPYPLEIHHSENPKKTPKAKLQANPDKGNIILDENTSISNIPAEAWDYKLGNRSALHWILDQYKEKKPRDQTIAEKFNTYKFADYKEQVTDLLKRVCTVSVRTMEIVREMDAFYKP